MSLDNYSLSYVYIMHISIWRPMHLLPPTLVKKLFGRACYSSLFLQIYNQAVLSDIRTSYLLTSSKDISWYQNISFITRVNADDACLW